MMDMLNYVLSAWNTIPGDIKSFIISAAAGAANDLYRGRKGSEQRQRFEQAYLAGLKALTVTLEKNHPGLVKKSLDQPKVRGLLLGIIENRSVDDPQEQIDELASALGLDPSGDDADVLAEAVWSFQICFESQAIEGADPLQWLIYIKIQEFLSEDVIEAQAVDLSSLKNAYLTHLRDDFKRITFKGYTKGKAISIPLVEIFTKPRFDIEGDPRKTPVFLDDEKRSHLKAPEDQIKSNSINDLLQCRLAVITGGPGAGKSTLLKYLALVLASGQLKNEHHGVLPIIFPISAYAEKRRKAGSATYTIKTFLSDYWQEQYLEDPVPLFEDYWLRGRALFLIDGLDEVTDKGERQKMISDVRYFIMAIMKESHFINRFYITCRTASYEGESQFEQIDRYEFRRFEMNRFDIDQIGHFLFSWYCWYERDFKKRKDTYLKRAEAKRDEMVAVLNGNDNIYDLATNPLMLTILALIEHEVGQFPNSRAELYSECLRILSGAWENLRSLWKREKIHYLLGDRKITDDMVVDFLGPVAFKMQEAVEKEVDETELIKNLTQSFGRRQPDAGIARDQAREFINIMRERSGLLDVVKPQTFGFLHQTFREYLTARWLAVFADHTSKLADRLVNAEWREVVLLMAASFSLKEASLFIKQLISQDSDRFAYLRLAGECVLDMGRDKIFDSTFDDLIAGLWDAIGREIIPLNKATLADIIGRLGDSRTDLEAFVTIPDDRFDLEDIGQVQLSAFDIGRYPVSNQWYSRFVKEKGYENESFWTPQGLAWLQARQYTGPRLIKESRYNCPTAPVVGVSWYEAAAFCNWLTHNDDAHRYFLPSQEQWQAAAAGTGKRKYPWGSDWNQGVCNTDESQIGRPSPVGIFAPSRTPDTHIYDMAGNVWEWTVTNHKSKEPADDFLYDEDWKKQRASGVPILKGGSWAFSAGMAACAARTNGLPSSRTYDVGFRCARTEK